MGNLLKTILSVIVIGAFIGTGANYVIEEKGKLQLKSIEVKSLTTELDQLNLKYDNLNEQLRDEKHLNKQQIEKLNKEKQEIEQEKQRLREELQAKKEAKSKLAKASETVVNRATGTSTASALSGSKEQWLVAAGIPQSDWQYVNCVIAGCEGVSAEGGWDGVQRWNTAGSGAYGLCQALPGSKMASAGADWETNPVTQLKWCHSYAQQYGGWAKAWEFRKCLGSCWSNSANRYVSKDHTWW